MEGRGCSANHILIPTPFLAASYRLLGILRGPIMLFRDWPGWAEVNIAIVPALTLNTLKGIQIKSTR